MEEIITFNQVAEKILKIRNQNVLLDSDVASLYGVVTMRINEAVKNNPDKFPKGYILELSKEEKQKVIEIFDNPKIKSLSSQRNSTPPIPSFPYSLIFWYYFENKGIKEGGEVLSLLLRELQKIRVFIDCIFLIIKYIKYYCFRFS